MQVTHDVSHLTCADFLSGVGKKTSLVVRLSTVTHEKGSPESLRDVRGFSVKFYTDEVGHCAKPRKPADVLVPLVLR